jgi:hypothetical protein
MRVSLTIENTYEDGDEVVVLKDEEIEDPPTPVDMESDAWSEWADDQIYPLTGTGRTEGDSWYNVTVTASSDPNLVPVGTTFEWGY